MEETIKSGTMLIAEDAILPESLRCETEPYAYGWRLVKNFSAVSAHSRHIQKAWFFSGRTETASSPIETMRQARKRENNVKKKW